jgi:DNA-binding NtrC family response regulator
MSLAKARDPSASRTDEPLLRLLIIDDDPAACRLIGRVAEKIGFVTTSADCLEAASKLLRNYCYDCITLDLLLGKSSAVALFRTLVEAAPATPVIIITGSPDWSRYSAVSLAKAARLNIVASITKPIELGDLREILTSIKEYNGLAAPVR